MTTEIILIAILALALAGVGLCWANAQANAEAYKSICDDLSHDKAVLTVELDRAKAAIELDRAKAAMRTTPVGPRFEWDDDDGCWVLKDCVRVDGGKCFLNVAPYYQYYNIARKKYKSTNEANAETTER